MSLQKVVSNYYVDLLDFLGSKYRKHNGKLESYIDGLDLDKDGRRQLINKMALIFQRIDMLRSSQAGFWRNKDKNQLSYVFILFILIGIAGVTLAWLLAVEFNSGNLTNAFLKMKALLTYIIIFMLIFSIMFIIIKNIQEDRGQTKEMNVETQSDLDKLLGILEFNIVENSHRVLFTFCGYKAIENKKRYNEIFNQNKSTVEKFLKRGEVVLSKSKKEKLATVDSFDYDKFFSTYKDTIIKPILIKFYDSGQGYNVLRKEIIGSSNILIMKEFNRIMEYYYKLVKRRDNAETLSDEKKTHDLLNKYVVVEFKLIKKILDPINPNAYIEYDVNNLSKASQAATDVTDAMKDAEFVKAYSELKTFFLYLMLYVYQVHLKQKTNEKDKEGKEFDASLKSRMPHHLDVSQKEFNTGFYTNIQYRFNTHFNTKLSAYITEAKASASPDALYQGIIRDFVDDLNVLFQNVILRMPNNYFFPVSSTFMKDVLQNDIMKTEMTQYNITLNSEYITAITKQIADIYIPEYWRGYEAKHEEGREALVSRITLNIAKFEGITLIEHKDYIKGQLEGIITPDIDPTFIEILTSVDRNVRNKKLSENSLVNKKSNEAKFLTIDQFIEELDKKTYVDLKVGLNLDYFGDILDKFYFAVNNSIYSKGNAGDKTSKDIFFNTNKNLKLASLSLNLVTVIIILCLVYHIMTVSEKFKYHYMAKNAAFLNKDPKDRDTIDLKKQFRDRFVNLMMQAGIPIAFAVFLVCLLQSVYKKAQARHNFNRETIDNNTSEFRAALQDLRVMFEEFESKITRAQMNSTIKTLTHIGAEEKTQLYDKLKIMIDKYDKCNYVLAVGKNEIPFPYTEVIIDGFMVLLILIAVVWVVGEIAPAQRFKDIKKNNKRKEEALYRSSDTAWNDAVIAEAQCHDASMENIMFTLKILFFIFIVMFLIFYATKVLASTSEYEFGIYNSMYFEESICLD